MADVNRLFGIRIDAKPTEHISSKIQALDDNHERLTESVDDLRRSFARELRELRDQIMKPMKISIVRNEDGTISHAILSPE